MPSVAGSGSISQPESFRVKSRICPGGDEDSQQIGLLASRSIRDVLGYTDDPLSPSTSRMETARRGQYVVVWKKGFLSLCGGVNHLANPMGFEYRIEIRAVDFGVDEMVG